MQVCNIDNEKTVDFIEFSNGTSQGYKSLTNKNPYELHSGVFHCLKPLKNIWFARVYKNI